MGKHTRAVGTGKNKRENIEGHYFSLACPNLATIHVQDPNGKITKLGEFRGKEANNLTNDLGLNVGYASKQAVLKHYLEKLEGIN